MGNRIFKSGQINISEPYLVEGNLVRGRRSVRPESNSDASKKHAQFTSDPKNSVSEEVQERAENALMQTLQKKEEEWMAACDLKIHQILEEANKEARKIIQSAEAKALELKMNASEDGILEGFLRGEEEGRRLLEKAVEDAHVLLKEHLGNLEEAYRSSESNMVHLAMEIARKVLYKSLQIDEKWIMELAKEALERTVQQEGLILELAKEDFERIKSRVEELCALKKGVEVTTNTALKQGDIIVHTDYGVIDGGVETKMQAVENALNEVSQKNEKADTHDT